MNYCLNPTEYFNMFPCPKSVVTEHLKICTENQLKCLLLCFSGMNTEEISNKMSLTVSDVKDALDFWVQRNVLLADDQVIAEKRTPVQSTLEPKKVAVKQKPTSYDAARRCNEDEKLQAMMSEAQRMLGRLLSPAEMSTLIWVHDDKGLDPAVILMAIQYATAEGIKGFSYVENMCIGWANDGVSTVQDAEEKIKQLFLKKSAWGVVESAFGIPHRKPTKREMEYSDNWINVLLFKKPMLEIAYEKCIDATGKLSFGYINKILQKWHEQGILEPADISKIDEKEKTKKASKSSENKSYDVSKIKNNFNKFD